MENLNNDQKIKQINNKDLDYFNANQASEIIGISYQYLNRLALIMKRNGYNFRYKNKYRLYNKYDLLIINNAIKHAKRKGMKVEQSLIDEIKNNEYSQLNSKEIPTNNDDFKNNKDEDISVKSDIVEKIIKGVSSMILDENQLYYNKLTDQIEELKKQNHILKENENWKEKYYQSENRRIEAENKLKHLALMNYRQFKKWKKTGGVIK